MIRVTDKASAKLRIFEIEDGIDIAHIQEKELPPQASPEAALVRKNRNAMMPNGVVEELIHQWDIPRNELVRP